MGYLKTEKQTDRRTDKRKKEMISVNFDATFEARTPGRRISWPPSAGGSAPPPTWNWPFSTAPPPPSASLRCLPGSERNHCFVVERKKKVSFTKSFKTLLDVGSKSVRASVLPPSASLRCLPESGTNRTNHCFGVKTNKTLYSRYIVS